MANTCDDGSVSTVPVDDAAAEHGVRHPYLEAGIDKRTVRRLAAYLGLNDLAELPADAVLHVKPSRDWDRHTQVLDILSLIHSTRGDGQGPRVSGRGPLSRAVNSTDA